MSVARIEWAEGLHGAMAPLLNPGEVTSDPQELAERAITMGKIDLALSCLQQEMGNNANVMPHVGYFVDELEKMSGSLTDENIGHAFDLLEAYAETVRKATGNTDLILTCLRLFEKADEEIQAEGKPTVFSPEAREDARLIVENAGIIKEALNDKPRFDRVYADALEKVKGFPRKKKSE